MLYRKLLKGIVGGLFWFFIKRKYMADKYVFFPSGNDECNKWGVIYLPEYLEKFNVEKAVVLISDKRDEKQIRDLGCSKIKIKKISEKRMDCMLSYYALMDQSDKWVVVSLQKPYSTGAEHLLGIKNVTYKELIYYDVYQL